MLFRRIRPKGSTEEVRGLISGGLHMSSDSQLPKMTNRETLWLLKPFVCVCVCLCVHVQHTGLSHLYVSTCIQNEKIFSWQNGLMSPQFRSHSEQHAFPAGCDSCPVRAWSMLISLRTCNTFLFTSSIIWLSVICWWWALYCGCAISLMERKRERQV